MRLLRYPVDEADSIGHNLTRLSRLCLRLVTRTWLRHYRYPALRIQIQPGFPQCLSERHRRISSLHSSWVLLGAQRPFQHLPALRSPMALSTTVEAQCHSLNRPHCPLRRPPHPDIRCCRPRARSDRYRGTQPHSPLAQVAPSRAFTAIRASMGA